MDFTAVYHFLFETYAGVGCLVGAGLILSILFAFISERRTKKAFKDRSAAQTKQSFDNANDENFEGATSSDTSTALNDSAKPTSDLESKQR